MSDQIVSDVGSHEARFATEMSYKESPITASCQVTVLPGNHTDTTNWKPEAMYYVRSYTKKFQYVAHSRLCLLDLACFGPHDTAPAAVSVSTWWSDVA
jgi:hypothetical protein